MNISLKKEHTLITIGSEINTITYVYDSNSIKIQIKLLINIQVV